MKVPGIRRTLPAAAVLVLVLAGTGCFFSPRDPEAPQSGTAVDYLDQVSPENVWANLGKSLENNDSGGWERNTSEEFVYVPDDETRGEFGTVDWDAWGREAEVDFIRKFYSFGPTNTDIKMRQDGFDIPTPGSEVVWVGVIYDLTVETNGSVSRYRGSADITFAVISTDWYVTRWEDIGSEGDPENPGTSFPTLGSLRGTTASN